VHDSDFRTVERIAHSLKSSAKSIGAQQTADLAYEIERAGADNKKDTICWLLADFKKSSITVIQELSEYLAHEQSR